MIVVEAPWCRNDDDGHVPALRQGSALARSFSIMRIFQDDGRSSPKAGAWRITLQILSSVLIKGHPRAIHFALNEHSDEGGVELRGILRTQKWHPKVFT